jgi:hypothetical protein
MMGLVCSDDGWRIPDWLWERIMPLLSPGDRIRWAAIVRACPTATR